MGQAANGKNPLNLDYRASNSTLKAKGSWTPSFTSNLLESQDNRVSAEDHEDLVLWTAGAVYAAGADTVSITLSQRMKLIFYL